MGYIARPTPEMGEYHVEIRQNHGSFYLTGDDSFEGVVEHGIWLYPNPYPNGRQGTVEIPLEDIPKIRAALDQVEKYIAGDPTAEPATTSEAEATQRNEPEAE